MPTNYPSGLDSTANLENDRANNSLTVDDHPGQHNNISDSIIAIETELGTLPKGPYSSVKVRLNDGVIKTPGVDQIIMPSGDFVALSVQASATQNTAALFDARNHAGTILAFIDRNGQLSAAGFKVSGVALASTHLADVAALAYLASPAFTGHPTGVTELSSDNSTRLATTAFVNTAIANIQTEPTGAIKAYLGAAAPTGYLLLDGGAYSRTTYANLFALIGTTYGVGNGTTTFNVPDYRGRMLVCYAASGGHVDVSTLGLTEGVALANRRPKHNQTNSVTLTGAPSLTGNPGIVDPGHSHGLSDPNVSFTDGDFNRQGNSGGAITRDDILTIASATTGISVNIGSLAVGVGSLGIGGLIGPAGTNPVDSSAYVVTNYIVKY